MPPKIKALVFDFGGVISKTLFETHASTERRLSLPPGSLTWRCLLYTSPSPRDA